MRIRRPLTHRVNRDRIPAPRPELRLAVRVRTGTVTGWEPLDFVVDTGADISIVPIPVAEDLGIPFARQDEPTPLTTQAGNLVGHLGRITAMVDGEQFEWACYFTELILEHADEGSEVVSPRPATARRRPGTVEAWANAQLGEGQRVSHTCLLGRAEFLTRDFDLHINETHFWLTWRRDRRWMWLRLWSWVINFVRREE